MGLGNPDFGFFQNSPIEVEIIPCKAIVLFLSLQWYLFWSLSHSFNVALVQYHGSFQLNCSMKLIDPVLCPLLLSSTGWQMHVLDFHIHCLMKPLVAKPFLFLLDCF